MRKIGCLFLLLLVACAPVAPVLAPTSAPTLTPTLVVSVTPISTATPQSTPTPGVRDKAFGELEKIGITVRQEDGKWMLLLNGNNIPDAIYDEGGQTFFIHDERIPVSEVSTRLTFSEDGILVLKDSGGNVIAGFGSSATKLEGKWFLESDVIGSPIVIGNTWDDADNWILAEKLFYKPFPADVYYPDQSKIVTEYTMNSSDETEPGFSERFPFGLLDSKDLDKSPFIPGANVKILEPNEAEGRSGYTVIFAQQVYDPNDPKHIQELNFFDPNKVYKTLKEAIRAVNEYSYYRKSGLYMLPAYYGMRTDILAVYPRFQGNYELLKRMGYIDSNGNVDQERLRALVIDFLETGKISPECERIWWLVATKVIDKGRIN